MDFYSNRRVAVETSSDAAKKAMALVSELQRGVAESSSGRIGGQEGGRSPGGIVNTKLVPSEGGAGKLLKSSGDVGWKNSELGGRPVGACPPNNEGGESAFKDGSSKQQPGGARAVQPTA